MTGEKRRRGRRERHGRCAVNAPDSTRVRASGVVRGRQRDEAVEAESTRPFTAPNRACGTDPHDGPAAHRTRASVSALDGGWAASVPDWSTALEAEVMIGDIEGVTLTIRTAAGAAEHAGEHDVAEVLWLSVPARRGVW